MSIIRTHNIIGYFTWYILRHKNQEGVCVTRRGNTVKRLGEIINLERDPVVDVYCRTESGKSGQKGLENKK